jgi:hypothetical protein
MASSVLGQNPAVSQTSAPAPATQDRTRQMPGVDPETFVALFVGSESAVEPDLKVAKSEYKELPLTIEGIRSNSANLTKEAVQNRAELRMRSAGLKPLDGLVGGLLNKRYLYININLVGDAFSIRVEFNREVLWVSEIKDGRVQFRNGIAATWDTATLGTHGRASGFILDALDRLLDEFLNEYLKQNQK